MKKVVVFLLVAFMIFGLTACQTTAGDEAATSEAAVEETAAEAEEDQIIVGFSIQDISNPIWVELYNEMEAEADVLGVELMLNDAKSDPNTQINGLENFITAGCDAIIVHCFDPEATVPTVEKAKAAGIKIVSYDTMIDASDSHFGVDNYALGKLIAKNAADFIDATFEDGVCEVGIGEYTLNPVCLERGKGIEAGLAEYAPNAVVVAKAQAGYTPEGIEVGENFMQAHPNMKVVCGIDDAGMLGVYESVVAAGKNTDDFGLFAVDAVDEALKLISEGTIFRSTITLDQKTVGREMLRTAVALVNGEEVQKETYFDMVTIDSTNVDEYIANK